MGKADAKGGETNTVRLSARTKPSNFDKLVEIAKENGWLNAQGRPNISRVLNFVIEHFDPKAVRKEAKRGKRRRDGS
jgi:hypothetical protein